MYIKFSHIAEFSTAERLFRFTAERFSYIKVRLHHNKATRRANDTDLGHVFKQNFFLILNILFRVSRTQKSYSVCCLVFFISFMLMRDLWIPHHVQQQQIHLSNETETNELETDKQKNNV